MPTLISASPGPLEVPREGAEDISLMLWLRPFTPCSCSCPAPTGFFVRRGFFGEAVPVFSLHIFFVNYLVRLKGLSHEMDWAFDFDVLLVIGLNRGSGRFFIFLAVQMIL
jgi:hypothetical protein